MTRKRVKQSLERQLTEPCPYCSGSGSIKSAFTICYEILTELQKIGPELDGQGVILRVNPDIARALKEEEHVLLRDLESTLGKKVTIKPDAHLHHEQFDVMAIRTGVRDPGPGSGRLPGVAPNPGEPYLFAGAAAAASGK